MKLTKKIEKEIINLMEDYWNQYLTGKIEPWSRYLVDNYRNIGGTEEELELGNIDGVNQILNLVTNAFYACNEKQKTTTQENENKSYKPTVWVQTKKHKDSLEISVRDNGNGIPKEVLNKIFQPFFTTKPTGQGTGLGLSLSYDIIKSHDGNLEVETEEKKGTTFKITLPI